MKKRTKVSLRTKIYLTIVGLLVLTGVLYAQFPPSHPTPLTAGVPFPTGVAAAPDMLLVSEFCSENIDQYRLRHRECHGVRADSGVWFLPGKIHDFRSIESANAGFNPRDVFVTEGALIFKIDVSVVQMPSRCLRRSGDAPHRTTTGLRSTMWAHLATT